MCAYWNNIERKCMHGKCWIAADIDFKVGVQHGACSVLQTLKGLPHFKSSMDFQNEITGIPNLNIQ